MSEFALQLAAALALTIAIELAVGAALGVRRAEEFAAVALVNVITNPALNVLATAAYGLSVHAVARFGLRGGVVTLVYWALICVAEVAVVFIEWRLLVWTLRAESDSRTWLIRSAAMNATSFVLGSWLLAVGSRALAR